MGGIIWLASYPKSDNTWFRVFLTNLLGNSEAPAEINKLYPTPIASARTMFDNAAGFEASDLTEDGIDRLRPEIYEHLAAEAEDKLFMKVHDAYTLVDKDTPLFPRKATCGAIYIIRNPLDVAVSFAHHSGWNYNQSISNMADETLAFCEKQKGLNHQLRQKLLSWSGHVSSWVETSGLDICVLRYEDMKLNSLKTFERAVRFAGLDYGKDEIQKAIDKSSFEKLRQQEEKEGFREKSPASEFFPPAQVERFYGGKGIECCKRGM